MSIVLVTEEAIPPTVRFSLTEKLAIEIAERGYRVYLVCRKGDGVFYHPSVTYHPVHVSNWSLFDLRKRIEANLKLVFTVLKVIKDLDVRLVYGWWPVLFFIKIIGRKKIISDMPEFIDVMYRTFNKPISSVMGFMLRTFQNRVARMSELIITESELSRNVWKMRGIDYKKTLAVPYGVDVDFFMNSHKSTKFKERYGIKDDEFTIMYHGDIGIDDGVDILIEATKGLGIRTVIIGDGDSGYMKYLRSIAHTDVIFTGWLPYNEMPSIIKCADLYVAPMRSSLYTNSTLPLKFMEAMASGRPVIISKVDTVSEYLEHGVDCIFVESGNVESLRTAIVELKASHHKMKYIGDNAIETAKKRFDYKIRVKKEAALLIKMSTL